MREDKDKVPEDFPAMKVIGRIYSDKTYGLKGKPYRPYYSAKEVWKWFRKTYKEELLNK